MLNTKRGLLTGILFITLFVKVLSINVNIEDTENLAFIESIIQVESRGRDNVISKDGSAGPLQIQSVLVKDINRKLQRMGDTTRFTLKDRFIRERAIKMFWIYQKFYGKNSDTYEDMARRWNGGPRGVTSKKTKKYWVKVNRVFTSILKHKSRVYKT